MMRTILGIAILFALTQSLAAEGWSDREVCRAATKTYFWLDKLPVDAPDKGDFMGFLSEKKNYYTCRINGDIADLSWVNMSSEKNEQSKHKGRISKRHSCSDY